MVLRLFGWQLAAGSGSFRISDRTEDGWLELAVVGIPDCWASRGQYGIWSMLIVQSDTSF